MLSGGGWTGVEILTFCPKFCQKPLPRDNVFCQQKIKHENLHPRAGELCQMFLPRGKAIHSRHPPRQNQTKKLYVAKAYEKQKSFIQSTPRNQIVINTKTQLMREQEANILLFLNRIKYNMLSFHSSRLNCPTSGKGKIKYPHPGASP